MMPSASSNWRILSGEPNAQLPDNSPLLLMTRCAGTPSGVSFMIQPTIRAPRGYPTDFANQPYVVTRPTGHVRTRAKTRAASSLTCSEDGDVSLDIAFTSPAFQTNNKLESTAPPFERAYSL